MFHVKQFNHQKGKRRMNSEKSGNVRDFVYVPSVTGLRVFDNGTAVVERFKLPTSIRNPYPRIRGKVKRLSRRSLERLIFMTTETGVKFKSMLTLTYPEEYPRDGYKVKSDLNRMLIWIKRNLGADYLWFLEFQARGAPHVHVLLDVYPHSRWRVAGAWASIVVAEEEMGWLDVCKVHAHDKQWQAIRHPDGARRYVAKYAAKRDQKAVPEDYSNVGRFWGASVRVKSTVNKGVYFDANEDWIRGMLEALGHRCADWDVLPRYIFGLDGREG